MSNEIEPTNYRELEDFSSVLKLWFSKELTDDEKNRIKDAIVLNHQRSVEFMTSFLNGMKFLIGTGWEENPRYYWEKDKYDPTTEIKWEITRRGEMKFVGRRKIA